MTPSLHRRDVLRLSASAVAAPLFGSTLGAFEPQNRKADVVVIGAGVSGLAAARELTAKKLDCIVLEARNRIGGRVWSDRAWGATLDLGASWIHGIRGNPIYELAQQYSIQTFPTRSDAHWLYREGAHEYEDDEQEVTESRVKKLLADARAGRKNAIADGRPDVSLQEAIERVMGDRRYTPLQRQEIDFQISSLIEQEYAADSEELSNNYYDHGEDFPGSDVLFPQGYIQIVRRLAEGLTIKLGHQVRRVDHDDKSVVIDTSQGEFTADFAVVTLPLGVLKHRGVEFHPALPERKRDAVQRMGMGLLNKTYLKFPRQFWPARADWLGFVSETKGRWSEYLNVAKFLAQPVLLGFTAATFARRTEKKTDQEIVAGMIAALRSMFGGRKVPDPLDVRITRWASDPFSYGSYSFMKTGSTPEDYEHLAEPVDNRLFFAGEHTSRRYSATVHGAYLSGIRAAKRIGAQV